MKTETIGEIIAKALPSKARRLARRRRASLRKGPGTFQARNEREETLLMFARDVTRARDLLAEAQMMPKGALSRTLVEIARMHGGKARAHFQALTEGRAAR